MFKESVCVCVCVCVCEFYAIEYYPKLKTNVESVNYDTGT